MVIKVDGVRINEVDVYTPNIYSLQWIDEYGKRWECIVESVGWNYMIRQILVLDSEKQTISDKTLDIEAIKTVKGRIKGFASGGAILTWHDMMIKFKSNGRR